MSKMTIVQLGVILVVVCLSTQVVSQSSQSNQGGSATTKATSPISPTVNSSSSSANTTSSTGAGVSLQAGTFSFLIPFIMAASFLQRYC